MSLTDVLAIWEKACEGAKVRWFLYRETLLCAEGYNRFPNELDCVHTAILAQDLLKLVSEILPNLPAEWHLNVQEMVMRHKPLSLECDGKAVMNIDVLWPVEGEEQAAMLRNTFKRIYIKPRKIVRNRKLLALFCSSINVKGYGAAYKKAERKAFEEVIALSQTAAAEAGYYTDLLTNRQYQLLNQCRIDEAAVIVCDGKQYPVFGEYRQYLKQSYGDYEEGLTDEIGVGLTAEEKEELKEHQKRCKEVLVFLQETAERFGLEYYLLAGSVLGAIREGGFIPWDDDIDVGVRVEKLEQFEAVVKEQLPLCLPAGFELVQSGADNPYPRMFSKICYNGRCCADLWPLIPTYQEGLRAKFTWYFAKISTKAHYYKIGYQVTRFLKVVKPLCRVLSDKQVMALARRNERKYVNRKTDAYINLYSVYKREKETIKREWLEQKAIVEFDGWKVPVVGCTDEYLRHLYGDYMTRPAAWKRASRHVERFYNKHN